MNGIFFAIVLIAFGVAGFRQLTWVSPGGAAKAPMDLLATAMIDSAEASVTLAIGLVGVMALFLGLMKSLRLAVSLSLSPNLSAH